jgi:hypothetical protein
MRAVVAPLPTFVPHPRIAAHARDLGFPWSKPPAATPVSSRGC